MEIIPKVIFKFYSVKTLRNFFFLEIHKLNVKET